MEGYSQKTLGILWKSNQHSEAVLSYLKVFIVPDGFVNFQSLALYDEVYGYVMSAVVYMATIQFLKLLQFNKKMGMLGDTIKLAAKDLKVATLLFT